VFSIKSESKAKSNGETKIVIVINPCIKILVHELIHVLWHVAKKSELDMNFDSQEWQAYFVEYLFTELKDFKKIPILKK